MSDAIRAAARSHAAELVRLRRAVHAYPEVGFKEQRTAKLIRATLAKSGVEHRPLCGTGTVAIVRGRRPGPTVLMRADIDALPVTELNAVPYASKNRGVMHACGHDGHVAVSLVAAKILRRMRGDFAGNVKFMFQPAEEGPGGAGPMIEAGLLKNPAVDYALATHMWNDLPTGKLGVRAGPVFAAVDEFVLTIRGRGGHGAAPEQTVDPVAIAALVVQGFQNVVSRKINPIKPSVITIGRIEAGTKHNIIPDFATLYGTVRSLEPGVRRDLQRWIKQSAEGIARGFGATIELKYSGLYPATVNDPAISARVRRVGEAVVGAGNVVEQDITMGAEDMSLVLRKVPGCYFLLGSRNSKKGLDHPHHSAHFDFDEAALPVGVETTVKAALDLLKQK